MISTAAPFGRAGPEDGQARPARRGAGCGRYRPGRRCARAPPRRAAAPACRARRPATGRSPSSGAAARHRRRLRRRGRKRAASAPSISGAPVDPHRATAAARPRASLRDWSCRRRRGRHCRRRGPDRSRARAPRRRACRRRRGRAAARPAASTGQPPTSSWLSIWRPVRVADACDDARVGGVARPGAGAGEHMRRQPTARDRPRPARRPAAAASR